MRLKYLILPFLVMILKQIDAKRELTFKLERFSFCPNLPNALIQLDKTKNNQIKMERNRLIVIATGNLTRDIKKQMEVHIVTEQCDATGDCTQVNDSTISNGCLYLEKLPFMKTGLGEMFTPPLKCPVKKGVYHVHTNVTLDQFSILPIPSRYRWKTRIITYEILSSRRKALVWCIEGLMRILASANRRH